MTFFEILSFRSEWELIVQDYKLDDYNSHIDNLKQFINDGAVGNRFRPNFDKAMEIATAIVSYYDKEINLPSLYWKEI